MTDRTDLDQARADLTAIEAELNAFLATKSEASRSPAAFAKWRTSHDAAIAERERLTTVIESLERDVTVTEAERSIADLRKRHAAKAAANARLAAGIKADLAKANTILLTLARDVAEAAEENSRINAELPDDLEPLVPADFIGRGRPGFDRKELSKTRVWLWVNARGGHLIGDQDSVVDHGNGFGRIGEASYAVICTRALFDQVEYNPAEQVERPQPLWQMRLPHPDGPGFEYDGYYPSDALIELARGLRAKEPRERPVETELRAVPSVEKRRPPDVRESLDYPAA